MIRMLLATLWTALSVSAVMTHWAELTSALSVNSAILLFPLAGALFMRDAWLRMEAAKG